MTRRQTYYTLAVMALALIVLGGNAIVSVGNIRRLAEREHWVAHTRAVISDLQTILADVTNASAAQRAYLLIGNDSLLSPARGARAHCEATLVDLRTQTIDMPEQTRRTDALRQACNEAFDNIDATLLVDRHDPANTSQFLSLVHQSTQIMDQIRNLVDEMDRFEKDRLGERTEASAQSLHNTIV
ncbi:MAG: CHASE3 domain-containing protein, partial [Phycisphaerae bacterium]|nr:CHASE3 domain-containing protein [Phycisphaerae bacterium]